MLLRENPYIAILCVTAIISGCVAFTAWTRRDVAPATRPFTWLMVAIAVYAAAASVSAATGTLRPLLVSGTAEYIASNSVIALYLTFTLHFTGRKQWLVRRRRLLLWILPIFNMAMVITNHWHSLVWSDFVPHPTQHQFIVFQHGPGYFWIVACFYIYVVTGSLLVARAALLSSNLYRRQAIMVILSALPPIVAGTLYALEITPQNANILPMSFLVTGLVYFTSLFRFRLFDLLPIARDTVIEKMDDGVLVIDNENRILDINPAARDYAQGPGPYPGLLIDQVLQGWDAIVEMCYSTQGLTSQVISRPDIACHIEVRLTFLYNRQQQVTGKLLVLRDITDQYQNQLKIHQANIELKQQLRQIQHLQEQLKEQAIRDELTGLFNRRYFEESLPAELAKAKRAGTSLSIVLMDIDYFKKVNDTYGHLAGDRALQTFAELVQQHIRSSDIACRYGGEEFILAMPDMPIVEAYQRADNIRTAFKALTIEFDGSHFQATVSMGLGAYPDFPGSQHELLKRIDQALYVAKANGRDRIEVANEKTAIVSKLSELERAIATARTNPKSLPRPKESTI
ncbi:MAG: histidine kinase N-terminal 7TM domain-containing protein [Cyanobacteria bacterium J06614_10]